MYHGFVFGFLRRLVVRWYISHIRRKNGSMVQIRRYRDMCGGSGGNSSYLLLALLASSAVSFPGILFRLSACQQILEAFRRSLESFRRLLLW